MAQPTQGIGTGEPGWTGAHNGNRLSRVAGVGYGVLIPAIRAGRIGDIPFDLLDGDRPVVFPQSTGSLA